MFLELNKVMKSKIVLLGMILIFGAVFSVQSYAKEKGSDDLSNIPEYSGEAYVEINENQPDFSERMIAAAKTKTYESYKALDKLKRCGSCVASIDQSIMPTEERGAIGQVRPSGWHTVKYNEQIEGNYLYNRCHLIGYQLTGENANKKNLVTGTRYLNVDGMLPFEDEVAEYLKKNQNNKVLYRVTPVYEGDNLVCSGVQMEAMSLNDNGKTICFNVYCYNVQPGIEIDYATGKSCLSPTWEKDIKKAVGANSVKGAAKTVNAKKATSNKTVQQAKQPVTKQATETKENVESALQAEVAESVPEPQVEVAEPTPEPQVEVAETVPVPPVEVAPAVGGGFAVNNKNGKIHMVGACPATGSGDNAMKEPVYFNTYEEAEAYSIQRKPSQDKRQCGNCW